MRLTFALIPALLTTLSACSNFPELDEAVDSSVRKAPYPDLVPLDSLTGSLPDKQIEPETSEDMASRIEQLQARAKRLNRPVVDDTSRERMDAGVN